MKKMDNVVSPVQSNSESTATSETDPEENDKHNFKNISPFMSKTLIAAAGFNIRTPIVSAIIGNLTGAFPTKKTEIEMIKCEICNCELSSIVTLKLHINGSKHRKRLKALEIISELKNAKAKGIHLGDSENPNAFRCEICLLTVNSAQQLEIHLSGVKHRKNVAKANCSTHDGNISSGEESFEPPAKKCRREEAKPIGCSICNIFLNSRLQYNQHILSKKHFNKSKQFTHPILESQMKFLTSLSEEYSEYSEDDFGISQQ